MNEPSQDMKALAAQQKAMIEQQRQDELLHLQPNITQEIAVESEHELIMQGQMLSVPPPPVKLMPLLPPPVAPVGLLAGTNMSSGNMPPCNRPSLLYPPPGLPLALAGNRNCNERTESTETTTSISEIQVQKPKQLPSLLSLRIEKPEALMNKTKEVALPQALEQVLALKDQRVAELGSESDVLIETETRKDDTMAPAAPVISNEYAETENNSEDDIDLAAPPAPLLSSKAESQQSKHRKKKDKKKRAKNKREQLKVERQNQKEMKNGETEESVEVEYIQETFNINELAPMHRQFSKIFEAFRIADKPSETITNGDLQPIAKDFGMEKQEKTRDNFDDEDDPGEKPDLGEKTKLSKRKMKKLTRLSVAELKQLVSRPDVVEMHDVTARDPKLLVQLKSHRNTVQVPRHWCFKRKYLQGKRGIEKPAFDLPAFIKRTGIMEMRACLQNKDEAKTLKSKMRERAKPKLGKIDIDYQKLHDAFFKWQTKPRMTIHGDLYYEGKEFETRLKEKKPGDISEEMKTALGMPIGSGSSKIPPPWLIAQQRYGPPPSYPSLKIPGLNAPIPDGCTFGYHTGGWGKPPVDEKGRPLYGDVFGVTHKPDENDIYYTNIDRTLWGEIEESGESSSEEEEEEQIESKSDESGLATPTEGVDTPSAFSSIPEGMETPEIIELRKKKIETDMEGAETPVLYQVIPERRTDRVGAGMMGSTHVYDMTGAGGATHPSVLAQKRGVANIGSEKEGAIELALDPSELDMDNDAMAMRYEQQIKEQQSHLRKEDLSDMLADHVARQKSKRKRQQKQDLKQTKKYKEFKF